MRNAEKYGKGRKVSGFAATFLPFPFIVVSIRILNLFARFLADSDKLIIRYFVLCSLTVFLI